MFSDVRPWAGFGAEPDTGTAPEKAHSSVRGTSFALDPITRFVVVGKLKLKKCAPILGLPEVGFLLDKSGKTRLAPGNRAGFFLVHSPRHRGSFTAVHRCTRNGGNPAATRAIPYMEK
jgi:hypothetical protein